MKIIYKGTVKPEAYKGKCPACGTVAEATKDELFAGDFAVCPLEGCAENIQFKPKSQYDAAKGKGH